MAGERLADLDVPEEPPVPGVAVKEAAFPFTRFDVDVLLGPEMRSTGEVMGFDDSYVVAVAKAQVSAGNVLPESGRDIVTVNERDRETVTPMLRRLRDLGFELMATRGMHQYLAQLGVPAEMPYLSLAILTAWSMALCEIATLVRGLPTGPNSGWARLLFSSS